MVGADGRSDCMRGVYGYHFTAVTTNASPMPTPQQTSVRNINEATVDRIGYTLPIRVFANSAALFLSLSDARG